jgi:ATP-dependent NAD(P)H-hydrate dehydratase
MLGIRAGVIKLGSLLSGPSRTSVSVSSFVTPSQLRIPTLSSLMASPHSTNNKERRLPEEWSDIFHGVNESFSSDHARALFPQLTSAAHKGSHGRIAIFGGSDKYTGAPYYAASAALNCGVDLVTVFCAKEASIPIKCYSPDLMVQSVYSVEEFDDMVKEDVLLKARLETEKDAEQIKMIDEKRRLLRDRKHHVIHKTILTITAAFPSLHTLCIGPGLGRHVLLFPAVSAILEKAMECDLALVLDADALYMLSLEEYRDILEQLMSYENVVMTPNLMESKRLKEALRNNWNNEDCTDDDTWDNASIVVQKGSTDVVSQKYITLKCKEKGGLKRSGGIGDVLAGTISAFVAWNTIFQNSGGGNKYVARKIENQMFAVWMACCTVKKATHKAFNRKKRAMSAQHVLEEISEVISVIEQTLES